MRVVLLAACLVVVPSCGREPLCSDIPGPTGGIPLCSDADEAAVCDDPGQMARYERDAAGRLVLMGGTRALCDDANEPVCSDRVTVPRCVRQPAE